MIASVCISGRYLTGWYIMFLSRRGNSMGNQVAGATLYQYNIKARSSSMMLVLPSRQRCMKLVGGLLAFKAV